MSEVARLFAALTLLLASLATPAESAFSAEGAVGIESRGESHSALASDSAAISGPNAPERAKWWEGEEEEEGGDDELVTPLGAAHLQSRSTGACRGRLGSDLPSRDGGARRSRAPPVG